jgi:hypothetical protein
MSRRHLVGAAGAAAIAGALPAERAAAQSATDSSTGTGAQLQANATIESTPAPTVGLSYSTYGAWSFDSNMNAVPRQFTGGVITAPGAFVVCPLDLPAGVRVRELTIWAANSAGVVSFVIESHALDPAASAPATGTAITIPNGALTTTPLTASSDFTIDPSAWYNLALFTSTTGVGIWAARVGYTASLGYVPVTPYRAYDSRRPGVPSPGTLTPNTSRVVSVRDAIDATTGAVTTAGVIPASARAVSYNITAAGTTGANFLSVGAGNVASVPVSVVNFSSAGIAIANSATVDLDAGNVKVFLGSGPGSSHFIIDITGYYL